MADWVGAGPAADAIGVKPIQLRTFARKHGCPHRRDGKRVYFDVAAVTEWYTKFKELSPKDRRAPKDDDDAVVVNLTKLPRNKDWVMWNRGEWRGWAVALVTSVDPAFVRVLVDYALQKQFYGTTDFRKSVAKGEVFIVNPDDTIEMIITQLSRFRSSGPVTAISLLREASKELRVWRKQREQLLAEKETDGNGSGS